MKLASGDHQPIGVERQRGSALSLQQTRRLHRQSTISCDGNFATASVPEKRSLRNAPPPASLGETGAEPTPRHETLVESDEFTASSCNQLRPVNEWPVKWSAEGSKNGSLASPASQADTSSRNSLSVPSTPMQHQAFTFDVFNGNCLCNGSV